MSARCNGTRLALSVLTTLAITIYPMKNVELRDRTRAIVSRLGRKIEQTGRSDRCLVDVGVNVSTLNHCFNAFP